MPLTEAQRQTLKTDILAHPDSQALYDAGDLSGLAALYNALSAPAFIAWKTLVTITEIGRSFVGTELAGLTTADNARLQTIALYSAGGVNPTLADQRAFFDDVFSGAGGTQTRTKLAVLWRRTATRLEQLYATGTGTDLSPATLVIFGPNGQPYPLTPQELIGL